MPPIPTITNHDFSIVAPTLYLEQQQQQQQQQLHLTNFL